MPDVPGRLNGRDTLTKFIEACHALDIMTATVNDNDKGSAWIGAGYNYTLYNHNMGINDHSCVTEGNVTAGAYTASSRHNHGINAVFTDGHVGFLADTITPSVWQALGTRNGGEVVSGF